MSAAEGDEPSIRRYFVDRDAATFGYVLTFLRTGALGLPERDAHLLAPILADARFFEISALGDHVRDTCRASPGREPRVVALKDASQTWS